MKIGKKINIFFLLGGSVAIKPRFMGGFNPHTHTGGSTPRHRRLFDKISLASLISGIYIGDIGYHWLAFLNLVCKIKNYNFVERKHVEKLEFLSYAYVSEHFASFGTKNSVWPFLMGGFWYSFLHVSKPGTGPSFFLR